jgi:hypothetical protein
VRGILNSGTARFALVGATRVWGLVSGLLVIYVITHEFTAVEQGYFYAFQSLGGAQFFFDLGIGVVLANLAGRKAAEGLLRGDSGGAVGLRGILAFSLKWTMAAAVVMVLILGAIGVAVFGDASKGLHDGRMLWLGYVALVAIVMVLNAHLSIFEGMGQVVPVAMIRTVQTSVNVVSLFVFARMGLGLQSMVLALLLSVLGALVAGAALLGPMLRGIFAHPGSEGRMHWVRDVLSFQWRIAVSWMAGYVVFQALVPVLFDTAGAVDAGRFGITFQVFQSITSFAGVILMLRIRRWTELAVHGRDLEFRADFLRVSLSSLLFVIGAGGCLLLMSWTLEARGSAFASRFLPFDLLVWLVVAAAANQVFFCANYYFRAYAQEPLWVVSLAAAICVAIAVHAAGGALDVRLATIVYTSVSLFAHGLGATVMFLRAARKPQRLVPLASDVAAR